MIDPNQIVRMARSGTGHMGDVTDEGSVCRFGLPNVRFLPVYIRGRFVTLAGGRDGAATLSIRVDHRDISGIQDHTLQTLENTGTGTDKKPNLNLRYVADELYTWILDAPELLVLEWTNPYPGEIRWGIEVGLINAAFVN